MKRALSIIAAVMIATAICAVPAKRGLWKTLKLADGTEVRAEMRGDEYSKHYRSEDGRLFVKDTATGLYTQTDATAITAKAAKKRAASQARRARKAAKAKAAVGETNGSYTGAKKGLIILVQFSDVKFKTANNPALFKRIANEEGFSSSAGFIGSVHDYFKAQSLGQFDLTFDVLGPVTMPKGYAYYGAPADGSYDNDKNVANMIIDACKAVDDQVDFNDYDWDGDGYADQVFILYAGHGEASSDDENTIWPHEWELKWALYPNYEPVVLDGVKIDTYACGCELGETGAIDGIGTICHEFSHCLGLPDMYDTEGDNYGMAVWSLMDYGSYNGDGFCPPNYTSYERMYAGWQQPVELSTDQTVTGMKSLGDGGDAYIIYNDAHKDEYYLLENRRQTGWDAELPGSGLLILHVDYDAEVWYENTVNTGSKQRCTIFHADNNDVFSLTSMKRDIYPYSSNNSLTNTSKPAATLYNANTDGTKYMNKPITEITRNGDGTVSFNFQNLNVPSAITGISADNRRADSGIYSIDGRYIGNDLNVLNKGIYIVNGKKYIK